MANPPATTDEAFAILLAELETPTFGFPYVDGTTADDADSANSLNLKDQTIGVLSVSGIELMSTIVEDGTDNEFTALSNAHRTQILAWVSAGEAIPVSNGGQIALALAEMFGPSSETRANLLALSRPATRFEKLLDDDGYTDVIDESQRIRAANSLTGAQVRKGWEYTP